MPIPAVKGARQVVFIGGEPGAGKTRLAAEVGGVLSDLGCNVLVGSCGPNLGRPYQPFAEMLDQLLTDPGAVDVRGTLEQIAPDLALLTARSEHPAPGRPRQEHGDTRRRLFAATARFLTALAEERPLVLVLEDLHWAAPPTLAMLTQVIRQIPDRGILFVGTFRTTIPDRSADLTATIADLYRLDGIRRLDLTGLDVDAIARYLNVRGGIGLGEARTPAVVLRDLTGGNPFFLRELWIDLQQRGGIEALRSGRQPVPTSVGDTLERRLAGLGGPVREVIELAAVLGDSFSISTLLAATDTDQGMNAIDAAVAVGLIEATAGVEGRYAFVHYLSRQAVLERLPPSRLALLHARAAQTLERHHDEAAVVPRLAHHYLACHVLGYSQQAVEYAVKAGRLAERSLAYEEAATWFEQAASLPETTPEARGEVLMAAASNNVRAGDFGRARALYERLATTDHSDLRLRAAIGYEEANWRPGRANSKASDLLTSALSEPDLDLSSYAQGLASLGRALAFQGELARAREIGTHALELARDLGDEGRLAHALKASLWHGLTPDMVEIQLGRSGELSSLAERTGDFETLGVACHFRVLATYMAGRPEDVEQTARLLERNVERIGQPFFSYVHGCITQGRLFLRGDFPDAEHWAEQMVELGDEFGNDDTEGSYGLQMFMIRRETGGLDQMRRHLTGEESLTGRWVPGLLALYTELGIRNGVERTLRHLMNRHLEGFAFAAQWPAELVFLVEGALAVGDGGALESLHPYLSRYQGKNLVAGQFVAVFGSADRYLGRVASHLGEPTRAEQHFATALEMDERMGSVVHVSETLAYHALHLAAIGNAAAASELASRARGLAEPLGHRRVLKILDALPGGVGPAGLSDREVEVLKLLAGGLSNREISERLYISANTAANHVRNILIKTGAANRTQAAMYAAGHELA